MIDIIINFAMATYSHFNLVFPLFSFIDAYETYTYIQKADEYGRLPFMYTSSNVVRTKYINSVVYNMCAHKVDKDRRKHKSGVCKS